MVLDGSARRRALATLKIFIVPILWRNYDSTEDDNETRASISGIATQTILTIPVSHVTNNQMVNLALSNGQVVTTTLANLQSIAQPQNMMNPSSSNGKKLQNQVHCSRINLLCSKNSSTYIEQL